MLFLQFDKTPYLGVHQTGSRPKLQNRSYAEGASIEGKTLAEFAKDRQRKKSKRRFGYLVDGD
jgi:hypothetical protein